MSQSSKRIIKTVASTSLLLLWIYIYSVNFWVSDDAFITLRTIDNFVSGFGLVFNRGERVQAYTHPLWMWSLVPFFLLTDSAVWAVYVLSLGCSVVAFAILFQWYSSLSGRILVFLLVCTSQAFVHYASSGLENVMGYALLGAIYAYYLDPGDKGRFLDTCFWFACSLACLIRPDYLLFVLFPLLHHVWIHLSRRTWTSLILQGFTFLVPLFVWHLFTLVYYGFPLPNTYYAKMETGIPLLLKLEKGMLYFYASLTEDIVTMAVLACVAIYATKNGSVRDRVGVLGIGIYLSYVAYIGGDFMVGRFFAVPFFLSLLLVRPALLQLIVERRMVYSLVGVLTVLLVLHPFALLTRAYPGLQVHQRNVAGCPFFTEAFVADEQCFYWGETNPFFKGQGFVNWFTPLLSAEEISQHRCIPEVVIGLYGYRLGSEISIIDMMGLADPLLARVLPDIHVNKHRNFRTGHISRRLPNNYIERCAGDVTSLEDPDLQMYNEGLREIVRGELWEWSRWERILDYNIGSLRSFHGEYAGRSYLDDELVEAVEAERLVKEKLSHSSRLLQNQQ